MERLRLYVNAIGKINFIYRIVFLIPITIISQCGTHVGIIFAENVVLKFIPQRNLKIQIFFNCS